MDSVSAVEWILSFGLFFDTQWSAEVFVGLFKCIFIITLYSFAVKLIGSLNGFLKNFILQFIIGIIFFFLILLAIFNVLFLYYNLHIQFCSELLFLFIMFPFQYIDVLLLSFAIECGFVDFALNQHHQLSLVELFFEIFVLFLLLGN
jgi:hypothetical protein